MRSSSSRNAAFAGAGTTSSPFVGAAPAQQRRSARSTIFKGTFVEDAAESDDEAEAPQSRIRFKKLPQSAGAPPVRLRSRTARPARLARTPVLRDRARARP